MTNDRRSLARGAPLSRQNGIAHDVVDGKLDELRALVAPALSLGAHVREPALDVRDLKRTQLVLKVEMLRDQRLDPRSDRRTGAIRCRAIVALLRARVRLEPEHLSHQLRAHRVAPRDILKYV